MVDKFIKNIDSVSHTWEGQEIAAGNYYQIQAIEAVIFENSASLLSAISAGEAKMARDNSGNNDINDVNDQINFLKGTDPQKDSDGAFMSRQKIAKTGHHYQALFAKLRIGHSDINCIDKDASSIGFWTVSRYDDQDEVTTDNAQAVKTVYEFEATHDIAIIGAKLYQKVVPGAEILLFVEAAPQFTPAQGGQVKFMRGGMDLDFMGVGNILSIDGKAPKDIPYDSVNHSGIFEFTFHHSVSTDHWVMPVVEYFMPPGI